MERERELIQDGQYRANKIGEQIRQDVEDLKGLALATYVSQIQYDLNEVLIKGLKAKPPKI
jgi:hypothetical protein